MQGLTLCQLHRLLPSATLTVSNVKGPDFVPHSLTDFPFHFRAAAVALQELVDLRATGDDGGTRTSSNFGRKKDHACPVCGRKFRGASYLRLHMRSHTGMPEEI